METKETLPACNQPLAEAMEACLCSPNPTTEALLLQALAGTEVRIFAQTRRFVGAWTDPFTCADLVVTDIGTPDEPMPVITANVHSRPQQELQDLQQMGFFTVIVPGADFMAACEASKACLVFLELGNPLQLTLFRKLVPGTGPFALIDPHLLLALKMIDARQPERSTHMKREERATRLKRRRP